MADSLAADQAYKRTPNFKRLKDWIDGKHHFKQSAAAYEPRYLRKQEFTLKDLQEALIYARNRLLDLDKETVDLRELAERTSSKISLEEAPEAAADTMDTSRTYNPLQLTPQIVRKLGLDRLQTIRKTIATYARLVQRAHGYNQLMKERIEEAKAS